jgi:predicted nucleic acid-binding protein
MVRRVTVAPVDDELVDTYARLRYQCRINGNSLHDKVHDADRWIASTAVRFNLTLVSDDKIFSAVPGLVVRRVDV